MEVDQEGDKFRGVFDSGEHSWKGGRQRAFKVNQKSEVWYIRVSYPSAWRLD